VKPDSGVLLIFGCLLYILIFAFVDYVWVDEDTRDPFAAMDDAYYQDSNLKD
jgi:hypothetical protein